MSADIMSQEAEGSLIWMTSIPRVSTILSHSRSYWAANFTNLCTFSGSVTIQ